MNRVHKILIVLLIAAASCLSCAGIVRADATDAPATRPARGPELIVRQIRKAVQDLDLTPDVAARVNRILDAAETQAQTLSQQLADQSPQQRAQTVIPFLRNLRQQLAAVLTPEQLQAVQRALVAGGENGGPMGKLRDALNQLDLSPQQKQQVDTLLQQTRQKIRALRDGNQPLSEDQIQQLRQDVRDQLQQILSPDQQQKLAELMQQNDSPQKNPAAAAPGQMQPDDAHPSAANSTTPAPRPAAPTAGVAVGAAMPKLPLSQLDGPTLWPASLKGHLIVLEFGSLSCPVFREQVPRMEQLKAEFGSRVTFLLVYTREAFPAGTGNASRNLEDGISIPQTTDLDARRDTARRAAQLLKITLPIVVDPMDDSLSNAYGTFPNGIVIIGRDGNIAARQQWTNADNVRDAVSLALSAK